MRLVISCELLQLGNQTVLRSRLVGDPEANSLPALADDDAHLLETVFLRGVFSVCHPRLKGSIDRPDARAAR